MSRRGRSRRRWGRGKSLLQFSRGMQQRTNRNRWCRRRKGNAQQTDLALRHRVTPDRGTTRFAAHMANGDESRDRLN